MMPSAYSTRPLVWCCVMGGMPTQPCAHSHTSVRHGAGYKEPLSAEERAQIDAKYAMDPTKFKFAGCLTDDRVRPRRVHRVDGDPLFFPRRGTELTFPCR